LRVFTVGADEPPLDLELTDLGELADLVRAVLSVLATLLVELFEAGLVSDLLAALEDAPEADLEVVLDVVLVVVLEADFGAALPFELELDFLEAGLDSVE